MIEAIFRNLDKYWPHYSIGSALAATALITFRETLTGFFQWAGQWFGEKFFKNYDEKKKMRLRAEKADKTGRGKLYDLIADNHVEMKRLFHNCEQRHKERDMKDELVRKALEACHGRNTELEVKNSGLRSMVMEGDHKKAFLEAENATLKGKLLKVGKT